MDDSPTPTAGDILIRVLRTALAPDGAQSFNHLVLYTTFGVVRGRIGYSFAQELLGHEHATPRLSEGLIELSGVTVEHFSNHLANAVFDRLYVRIAEVQGFAFVG